jgi:hypothetical protein
MMKWFVSSVVLCGLFTGCSSNPPPAPPPGGKGVEVHAPGVDVNVEKGGVDVKAPGADVQVERKP